MRIARPRYSTKYHLEATLLTNGSQRHKMVKKTLPATRIRFTHDSIYYRLYDADRFTWLWPHPCAARLAKVRRGTLYAKGD